MTEGKSLQPPDFASGVRVLHARVLELENERDQYQTKLAEAWKEVAGLRRKALLLDVLVPVAQLYVDAFTDDDKMNLLERLRLQDVENALKELSADV